MTKKTENVVAAYRAIIQNKAKVTKMEDSEKSAFLYAAHQLKKVAADFDDYAKSAQETLKPEGFDAIAAKSQANEPLTEEEAAELNKYGKEVSDSLTAELEKEVELGFEPLTKEAFGRFVASNDLSINDMLVIEDALCA